MAYEERPPRGMFENLADGSTLDFLFNSATVEESIEANYEDSSPIGLSHSIAQYTGTGNLTIPLELYLSDDGILRHGGDESRSLMEMRAWILSLHYPVSHQDFGRVGTPRVLFVWPNVWRVIGRLRKTSIAHQQFDRLTLRTTKLTIRTQLVVELESRTLMSDVQNDGATFVYEE